MPWKLYTEDMWQRSTGSRELGGPMEKLDFKIVSAFVITNDEDQCFGQRSAVVVFILLN